MELDVNGDLKENPTAQDVSRAIDAEPKEDDWYLVLERDVENSVEANPAVGGGYDVYVDEGDKRLLSAKPVSGTRLKELFALYLAGDGHWRDMAEWTITAASAVPAASSRPQSAPIGAIVGIAAIIATTILGANLLPKYVKVPEPLDPEFALGALSCFVATVVVVGIVFAVKSAQSRKAVQWPQAGGRIIVSRVERRGSDDDGDSVAPFVEYEFSVAGTTYRGSRITIGEESGGTNTYATVERYPVGATVMVYYDPANPKSCVLEPKMPEGLGKGCLMMIALGIAFLAGIFWLATEGPALVTKHFPKANAPFALALTGFGAVILLFSLAMRKSSREAAGWPKAQGRVTKSVTYEDGDSGFAPLVEYTYSVNGIDLVGRQITLDVKTSASKRYALKRVARYPVGAAVQVRYDPKNPARAALEVSASAHWFLLALSLAFFAGAAFVTGVFDK